MWHSFLPNHLESRQNSIRRCRRKWVYWLDSRHRRQRLLTVYFLLKRLFYYILKIDHMYKVENPHNSKPVTLNGIRVYNWKSFNGVFSQYNTHWRWGCFHKWWEKVVNICMCSTLFFFIPLYQRFSSPPSFWSHRSTFVTCLRKYFISVLFSSLNTCTFIFFSILLYMIIPTVCFDAKFPSFLQTDFIYSPNLFIPQPIINSIIHELTKKKYTISIAQTFVNLTGVMCFI